MESVTLSVCCNVASPFYYVLLLAVLLIPCQSGLVLTKPEAFLWLVIVVRALAIALPFLIALAMTTLYVVRGFIARRRFQQRCHELAARNMKRTRTKSSECGEKFEGPVDLRENTFMEVGRRMDTTPYVGT